MDQQGDTPPVSLSGPVDSQPEAPAIITFFLTLPLALLHAVWCYKVDYLLLRLCGGVQEGPGVTTYVGMNYAWVNLVWAPGGLAMGLAGKGILWPQAIWLLGVGLVLAGSVMAAYSASSSVVRAVCHRRPAFGRHRWRLWLMLAAWLVWIPVPLKYSIVYLWTVEY
jgi:hypothetical protein